MEAAGPQTEPDATFKVRQAVDALAATLRHLLSCATASVDTAAAACCLLPLPAACRCAPRLPHDNVLLHLPADPAGGR